MFEHLRNALRDLRVEKGQAHGDIGIAVLDLHEHAADGYRDAQLLAAFAYQRRLLCLTRLDLAAGKFPQQPARLSFGLWQIMNLSSSQTSAATTSVMFVPLLYAFGSPSIIISLNRAPLWTRM